MAESMKGLHRTLAAILVFALTLTLLPLSASPVYAATAGEVGNIAAQISMDR